jgi:hypothetical protein
MQKEMPSLEEVIAEERVYFLRTDSDGDEKLSKDEFTQHFLESMGMQHKFLLCFS